MSTIVLKNIISTIVLKNTISCCEYIQGISMLTKFYNELDMFKKHRQDCEHRKMPNLIYTH